MRKLILAALVAVALPVAAQQAPSSDANPISTDRADKAGATPGDRRPLAELDLDDDGVISKNEVQADNELISRFSRYDSDGDEVLSAEEYDAYLAGGVPAAGTDTDDDAIAEDEQPDE